MSIFAEINYEMWQAKAIPPVHPTAQRRAKTAPVILMVWHDIVPAKKLVWFDTTVSEFEKQLQQMEKAGANPISLDTLASYLTTGSPVPPPGSVVLCFDDNTVGIYDYAAPRLQKRGWAFAVSAHTAYVGVPTSKKHNTYAMLKEMEQGGAVIVSQTHTHPPDLTMLNDVALTKEMRESKKRMEAGLGHPVPYITYPSGKWNQRVARVAAQAGYRLGLTEDHGFAETSPHLLAVHRYSTHKRFTEAIRVIQKFT